MMYSSTWRYVKAWEDFIKWIEESLATYAIPRDSLYGDEREPLSRSLVLCKKGDWWTAPQIFRDTQMH